MPGEPVRRSPRRRRQRWRQASSTPSSRRSWTSPPSGWAWHKGERAERHPTGAHPRPPPLFVSGLDAETRRRCPRPGRPSWPVARGGRDRGRRVTEHALAVGRRRLGGGGHTGVGADQPIVRAGAEDRRRPARGDHGQRAARPGAGHFRVAAAALGGLARFSPCSCGVSPRAGGPSPRTSSSWGILSVIAALVSRIRQLLRAETRSRPDLRWRRSATPRPSSTTPG